ncbi:MAG: ATP synthase F1 subunit epsilon, partial [Actinomycetota bacterium]
MQVDLVSPEEILFSGECTQVLTRTSNGEIAFLNDHAPFIGVLEVGAVRLWQADGTQTAAAVQGGFVEVSGNTVTILSDIAVPADRIDAAEAQAAVDA